MQLAEVWLTQTYQEIFRFFNLERIDLPVLRYLITSTSHFEKWPQEWLHHGEVQFSNIPATDSGGDLI